MDEGHGAVGHPGDGGLDEAEEVRVVVVALVATVVGPVDVLDQLYLDLKSNNVVYSCQPTVM